MGKKMTKLTGILVTMFLLAIGGCFEEKEKEKEIVTHIVTFNSNGGTTIASITNINYNSEITEPIAPVKSGSTFEGWYKESELKNKWNFTEDKIITDTKLYAKYISDKYILIEGGIFTMGDTFGIGDEIETPIHLVTVSSFYMNKYEITRKEYVDEMEIKENIKDYGDGDNHPVYNVSWWDAIKYCNKLSEKEGFSKAYNEDTGEILDSKGRVTNDITQVKGYRLPTESEWEYAVKGGRRASDLYKKYSGSNIIEEVAVYDTFSTNIVGSKIPNELGIFDMSGNVWEWCSDIYENYSSNNQINPIGAKTGLRRIFRGGSWYVDAYQVRSTFRGSDTTNSKYSSLGFRPTLTK